MNKNENDVHKSKETKKEEAQEETVERANKAKNMLYKETKKSCGLKKESVAARLITGVAKKTVKKAPKKFQAPTGGPIKTDGLATAMKIGSGLAGAGGLAAIAN